MWIGLCGMHSLANLVLHLCFGETTFCACAVPTGFRQASATQGPNSPEQATTSTMGITLLNLCSIRHHNASVSNVQRNGPSAQ